MFTAVPAAGIAPVSPKVPAAGLQRQTQPAPSPGEGVPMPPPNPTAAPSSHRKLMIFPLDTTEWGEKKKSHL